MIAPELEQALQQLRRATIVEDVFGTLPTTSAEQMIRARQVFHRLARITHPDRYLTSEEKHLAHQAFGLLATWWRNAQDKIQGGCWGRTPPPASVIPIKTKKRTYLVGQPLAQGDVATLYECTYTEAGKEHSAIFKIASLACDNDLLKNEIRVLRYLRQDSSSSIFHRYLPEVLDSAQVTDRPTNPPRHATVLARLRNVYSWEQVIACYPTGIDPRDAAWMYNRLLEVLGYVHQRGVVHGAILPPHILIHPDSHGAVLIDWSYAVLNPAESGERIRALSVAYEPWYPPEVKAGRTPSPATDLFMAARSLIALLGGNPLKNTLPTTVPRRMKNFLQACVIPSPLRRPHDAWQLRDEAGEILRQLFGSRAFRPFTLPSAATMGTA